MNKDLTEIVFILDRSGSMTGLEKETISGYNSFLEKQKKLEKEAVVTTVLFDDEYEVIHNRVNIININPLTGKEYYTRGSTALLDAIGKTIKTIYSNHLSILYENRPGQVIFVIITDGYENASREFTYPQIRHMINERIEKDKWEFIFLGANMDAIKQASDLGIAPTRAANYHADADGTSINFSVLNDAILELRILHKLNEDWKKDIDEDFNKRSNK